MTLNGITVDLSPWSTATGGSTGLTAYTVRPPGDEKLPGVVMLHEAFGLEDITRRQADLLADMGYAVVVPDLFADGGSRKCLKATFKALSSGQGRAFHDIAASRQWMLDRDDATGAIGVIGFCMGGGCALRSAAPEHGFDVSAVNYGRLPSSPDVLAGG
ncbi:MAG: dienelactone hydrolase family protein, partial [Actinomycetota bacterium]|nr:dienelactone hydrolase family protein [Actinomycetota bacterium]